MKKIGIALSMMLATSTITSAKNVVTVVKGHTSVNPETLVVKCPGFDGDCATLYDDGSADIYIGDDTFEGTWNSVTPNPPPQNPIPMSEIPAEINGEEYEIDLSCLDCTVGGA